MLFDFEDVTTSSMKQREQLGGVAQLGEHLPCTQGVKGSSPLFSTKVERPKYLEN